MPRDPSLFWGRASLPASCASTIRLSLVSPIRRREPSLISRGVSPTRRRMPSPSPDMPSPIRRVVTCSPSIGSSAVTPIRRLASSAPFRVSSTTVFVPSSIWSTLVWAVLAARRRASSAKLWAFSKFEVISLLDGSGLISEDAIFKLKTYLLNFLIFDTCTAIWEIIAEILK